MSGALRVKIVEVFEVRKIGRGRVGGGRL